MRHMRPAYSLLLAIVLAGAIGITLAIMTGTIVRSVRSGSMAELSVRAWQLTADGQSWIRANPERVAELAPGRPLGLTRESGADQAGICEELSIVLQPSGVLLVQARITRGRRSASRAVEVRLPLTEATDERIRPAMHDNSPLSVAPSLDRR